MEKTKNRFELNRENILRAFGNSFWTLKLIFKLSPSESSIIILIKIISVLLITLEAYLSTRILDQVVKVSQEGIAFQTLLNLTHPLTSLVLLVASINFIIFILQKITRYIDSKFREVYLQEQTRNLYSKILSLSIEQHESTEFTKGIKRAENNMWRMRTFFDETIELVETFIELIISGVLIYTISPLLFIIIIILGAPKALLGFSFTLKRWSLFDAINEYYKKRNWISNDILFSNAIAENIITGARYYLLERIKFLTNFISSKNLSLKLRETKVEIAAGSLSFLQEILSAGFVLHKTISGAFSIGDFSFYWTRTLMFTNSFRNLLETLILMFDDMTAVEDIRMIFEARSTIQSGNVIPEDIKKPPTIEFKNVKFKYPESKNFVFKDLNIKIVPGQEIAIVGENGAGKTTFLKLLLRFYDPVEGEILIDGINIKSLNLDEYYKRIGAIFQDYNIYQYLSIKENITIGKPNEKLDRETFDRSLELSEANNFVNKLENKADHIMDKRFENGVNLSSGQKQKVALARMFYRDAPVLILDEPTSSIDAVAESKIFNRIYESMTNKTVIIISHRFSTVRKAQKIYVLDKGKIVESGSHSELMKLNRIYADSFNMQAEGYTKED